MVFDDEDGSVRLKKKRSLKVRYTHGIENLAAEISNTIPELKQFTVNIKKERAEYNQLGLTKIGSTKVRVSITIQQILDDIYLIEFEYSTRLFRPFLLIFSLLGLLFGLVPGLIIYFMFHESDASEVEKVTPALERFETLILANEKMTRI